MKVCLEVRNDEQHTNADRNLRQFEMVCGVRGSKIGYTAREVDICVLLSSMPWTRSFERMDNDFHVTEHDLRR